VFGISSESEWFIPAGAADSTMEYVQLTNGSQSFGFDLRNNLRNKLRNNVRFGAG
jgi:hypothetical protein